MNTLFQLMIISFVLVALTTISGVVGEGNDTVYDSEGEAVKTNVPYYISFMTSEYDMWICRMNMGSQCPKSCPQQPVMFTHPNITAMPVMLQLSSTLDSDVIVHESTKLSIKFVNPGPCGESGFWRVAQNSTTSDGVVVLNGSKSRNDSTFTIHKTNEFYMFGFGDIADPTIISLSTEPGDISTLLAKKSAGIMEVYFYRIKP